MISGTPKFDSLAVKEIAVEFRQMGQVSLICKAAFVNSTAGGNTHGWTRGDGAIWSPETLIRLQALRESMEMDLGELHFTNASASSPTPRAERLTEREVTGLGEYLSEEANQA